MTNRIGILVKDIQYATDFTIEQIADKIDYSRAHLTRLAKRGDSKKVYDALLKQFGQIAQNTPVNAQEARSGQKNQNAVLDKLKDKLTTQTKTPVFEMKQTNGNGKDQVTVLIHDKYSLLLNFSIIVVLYFYIFALFIATGLF